MANTSIANLPLALPSGEAVIPFQEPNAANASGVNVTTLPGALGLGSSNVPVFAGMNLTTLTASRVVVSDGSKSLTSATTTLAEVNSLSGIASNVQTQLDGKAASNHTHNATDIGAGNVSNAEFYSLDGVTSSIQGQFTGVNASLVGITTAFGTTNTSIATNNASIVSLNGSFTTLNASLGTVNASLTTINTTLTAAVNATNATVAALNTTIGTVNTSLTTVNSTLTAAIAATNATVLALNSTVATLNGTVATNNASLITLNGTVSGVLVALGTQNTSIASIGTVLGVHNAAITAINTTAASVGTVLGTHNAAITAINATVAGKQTANTALSGIANVTTTLVGVLVQFGNGAFGIRNINGTTNRVSVSTNNGSSGDFVLTTPQDLHTSASVTFGTLQVNQTVRFTGIDAGSILSLNSTGHIVPLNFGENITYCSTTNTINSNGSGGNGSGPSLFPRPVFNLVNENFTVDSTNASSVVRFNMDSDYQILTILDQANGGFTNSAETRIVQFSPGIVVVVPQNDDITILSENDFRGTNATYDEMSLVRLANNTWYLSGDLADVSAPVPNRTHYWPFNDTLSSPLALDVVDFGSALENGTASATGVTSNGTCFTFDGLTGQVTIPSLSSNHFEVEFEIRAGNSWEALAGGAGAIIPVTGSDDATSWTVFVDSAGNIYFNNHIGFSGMAVSTSPIPDDQQWHTIRLVYNGSSIKFFIDEVAAGTPSFSIDFSGSSSYSIGAALDLSFAFQGDVKNVKFW